jgi:DNA-binding transcriptional LysR family regulator
VILRHLRYFVAVAEHGSIVGAAQALRLSQPPLSRQIRALENEAGVALLERTRRGVVLTPAGSTVLTGAQAVVARLETAIQRAHLAHAGKLGKVRIGLGRAATDSARVAHAITALRTQLPEIELEIVEVSSFLHRAVLLGSEVDIALGLADDSDKPGIRKETLLPQPITAALISERSPLAGAKRLRPDQLRGERLLLIDPSITGFKEMYRSLEALHGGPIELHRSIDSLFTLVAAGRGWSPTIEHLDQTAPPVGTVIVPVEGLNYPTRMCVAWRTEDRSRLVSNVVSALRRACAGGKPAPSRAAAERRGQRAAPKGRVTIEARHLRALEATIAEGSLSRGARRLGVTQSALSRQLRALENEVGVDLFRRGPTGIAPNHAAGVFRGEAAAILSMIDAMLMQARATRHGITRRCRIGSIPTELMGGLLIDAMRRLNERTPDITIDIVDMFTPLQQSALRTGEIDVGISRVFAEQADEPDIASVWLDEDVMECALVSETHALASRAWLEPRDLAEIPFLFLPRRAYPQLYDAVIQSLRQIGVRPLTEGSVNGARAIWRLVAASMGWTIGSRHQRDRPPIGTVAIPIAGLRIPAGVRLVWRRDETDTAVKAVLDAFRDQTVGVLS